MRLSTIFVSSIFVLAGMSRAIPVEREDMLMARFADFDFLTDVEARAYGDGPELYSRGSTLSQVRNTHQRTHAQTDSRRRGDVTLSLRGNLRRPAPAPPPYDHDPPPYQSHAQTNSPPPSYESSWRDPVVMSNTMRPRGSRRQVARGAFEIARTML